MSEQQTAIDEHIAWIRNQVVLIGREIEVLGKQRETLYDALQSAENIKERCVEHARAAKERSGE